MIAVLIDVFITVIVPVFCIVGLGFFFSKKLKITSQPLTRTAYYFFIPAFVFNQFANNKIDPIYFTKVAISAVSVFIIIAFLAYFFARGLGRDKETATAYVLAAVFANTGNFGLPMITFRYGEEGLLNATVFFLPLVFISFTLCVGAAARLQQGSTFKSIWKVFKTPAILASIPALFISGFDLTLPVAFNRITEILGQGMIPTMLFAAGVQLGEIGKPDINSDVILGTMIKLLIVPCIAMLIIPYFEFEPLAEKVGIIQTAMPTAVLAMIIAGEFNVKPKLVTTIVLLSSVIGLFTLTILLTFI